MVPTLSYKRSSSYFFFNISFLLCLKDNSGLLSFKFIIYDHTRYSLYLLSLPERVNFWDHEEREKMVTKVHIII